MPFTKPYAMNNPYFSLGTENSLAEGVYGHLIHEPTKGIYIVTIRAKSEGKGFVSSYISQLQEEHSSIRFPNVISRRLENLLLNKGFKKKIEHVPFLKDHAEVYVWKKKRK